MSERTTPEGRNRRSYVSARNVTIIALAAIFVGVGPYVLIAALSSNQQVAKGAVLPVTASRQPTAGPTGGPMPGAPVSLQTSFTRRPATTAQPGPKPMRPSDPRLIKSWKAGPGGKTLNRVTAQAANVQMAQATGQYTEMPQYCGALTSAVQGALAAPAIPDSGMGTKYSAALTALKTAASDCTTAITVSVEDIEDTVTHVNNAEINRSMSELKTGLTDLYIATEMLRTQ